MGANELTMAGKEIIHIVVQDVKEWLINKYNGIKSKKPINSEAELEKLERQLAISDEYIEIGMRKKEIAVMWAMKKLGYVEEETKQILNLANEAYKSRNDI